MGSPNGGSGYIRSVGFESCSCFLSVSSFCGIVCNLPGGGASVAVVADLFPENAGGRDRCPATGTTSLHDLSPDRGDLLECPDEGAFTLHTRSRVVMPLPGSVHVQFPLGPAHRLDTPIGVQKVQKVPSALEEQLESRQD
ncbi:hypothetical protein DPX16_1624 [Anabarilius grahami]|uniref:Uncharacterized protein n=1 Tax=Anabarilius grahami TaxID=495550 RepID=A0A3N0YHB8_ANAGA|nr:hypothetical protein DPX16_1624 [Anabarilius grahami]